MSTVALQYVKDLAQAMDGRAVTSPEWAVLRALALMHEPVVQCAFAPMAKIAYEAMMGERNARRVVGRLEAKGLVLRIHAARDHDGSQTTNEYELPGLAGWMAAQEEQTAQQPLGRGTAGTSRRRRQVPTAVVAGQCAVVTVEARRKVFRTPRTRMEVQRPLALAEPLAGAGAAVENVSLCPPPPDTCCPGPPGHLLSARDVVLEVCFEDYPTPTPAPVHRDVQNNGKNLPGDRKSQTATAGAAATATTVPVAATSAGAERWAGRTGSRARRDVAPSASPVNGFERQPGSHDALLHEQASRVLMACGIAPETSTRRLRAAVEAALRLRCEQTRVRDDLGSVGDAGLLAVTRWEEYRDAVAQSLLRYEVGVRKFFDAGVWLNPAMWPIDRDAVARRQRL